MKIKSSNLSQKKIYKRIVRWYRFEIFLRSICFVVATILCFGLFYSYYLNNVKSKTKTEYGVVSDLKLNVMERPKMLLEYDNGNYYDLDSEEATFLYKKNKDIESIDMRDIKIHSDMGYVQSEKLFISNNMNTFKFTGNPILIINPNNYD